MSSQDKNPPISVANETDRDGSAGVQNAESELEKLQANNRPISKSGDQAIGTSREKDAQNLQVPQETAQGAHRSRTGSVVSFKEQSDIYEIDLESEKRRHAMKPPAVFSLRYYVMFLALFSPFVVTYSKTIINFAIIDMIHPDYLSRGASKQATTTKSPLEFSTNTFETTASSVKFDTTTVASNISNKTIDTEIIAQQVKIEQSYFELDNSCPVDETQRVRLNKELEHDRRRARDTVGEKFEWDTVKQGLLKAAYSIGHAVLQVAGGRLSEIYGSHLIMSASSLLIAVACFSAPFLAGVHFYLMFLDLFILGLLGSFMTPALITLFSNWLTPSEKSMMLSCYLISSRLGYALSSILCGFLIDAELSWKYLFYSAGWTGITFSSIFWLVARSRPNEHPFIKEDELYYLASKNTLVREAIKSSQETKNDSDTRAIEMSSAGKGTKGFVSSVTENSSVQQQVSNDRKKDKKKKKKPTASAPWLAILTSVPVWAFVVTKFCVKLAGDTVQIELPAYLNRVMHFPAKSNGTINAWNYVIFCISCLLVGAVAKHANKKHPFGCSKTTVRKLFQCTASFGVGTILILMSMTICQKVPTVILLMFFFFTTTFGTGGEAQIPLDISERYAGTIHAIGSSLAISGAIEPILVGYLLRGHAADKERWRFVWLGASAFAFLGGFVFLTFGDATIQPFDEIALEKNKKQQAKTMEKKRISDAEKVGNVNRSFEQSYEVKSNATGAGPAAGIADQSSYQESGQI